MNELQRYSPEVYGDATCSMEQDDLGGWVSAAQAALKIAELLDAALAYQALTVIYRTGGQPTERLHERLAKAKETVAKARGGDA